MTYVTRTICIIGQSQVDSINSLVKHLPRDGSMEVVIREYKRKRSTEANSLYWLRLQEIADQAWIDGKQYSAETIHEFVKRKFLPDEIRKGKEKWVFLPNGERVLCMSTTDLGTAEFAEYIEQVEAWAITELGIRFSANPNEGRS